MGLCTGAAERGAAKTDGDPGAAHLFDLFPRRKIRADPPSKSSGAPQIQVTAATAAAPDLYSLLFFLVWVFVFPPVREVLVASGAVLIETCSRWRSTALSKLDRN